MKNKPLIKKSKRSVTLLEVLIAMALTVVVLSTLTFFYREVSVINDELSRVKSEDFYMRFIESRLSDIFPRILSAKSKDFAFFSLGDEGLTQQGSQSLVFTFDHGVSLDKIFSNQVLGRLYVDPKKNLTLAYWPSPNRWDKIENPPMKKEILIGNIESLHFNFFVAPEKSLEKATGNSKSPQEPLPKGEWSQQLWLKDFQQLPIMVKVILKVAGRADSLVFVFALPNAEAHVVYD